MRHSVARSWLIYTVVLVFRQCLGRIHAESVTFDSIKWESCIRQHNKQFAACQAGKQSKMDFISFFMPSLRFSPFCLFVQRLTSFVGYWLFVCSMRGASITIFEYTFVVTWFLFIYLSYFRCRFGSRTVEPNGGVKRNRKVCVLVYRISRNCLIEWHAMVAAYRWIHGYPLHFYQRYQVTYYIIDSQFHQMLITYNSIQVSYRIRKPFTRAI